MWGSSIVGFGEHHYRYASGREGDWFEVGFSPRARSVSTTSTGRRQSTSATKASGQHSTNMTALLERLLPRRWCW